MNPARRHHHALHTLRHRDFRLLWSGQLVSTTGQQMQAVAVAWHIYLLTDSALHIGLIGLFRAAPLIALSFAGGATADLLDRKRILIAAHLFLLVLTGALALSTATDLVTPWVIYIVTLGSGAAAAFDTPARQALVPRLVPRDELTNALTLNTLLRHLATIVGPGVGGMLIGQLGLAGTYGLSAASSLAVLGAVLLMGPTPVIRRGAAGGWTMVLGGLRFVRGEPLVLYLLALDFALVVVGSTRALLPIFARDILAVGPQGLGLLHAAPAVGAVVGATALGALGGARRPTVVILVSSVTYGLFVIGFGLSGIFLLSLLMLFGLGVADVVASVLRSTLIQLRTPDELRGRVTALNMVFTQGGPYLGQFESGVVASLIGPIAAAVVGGCGVLLAASGFLLAPAVRRSLAEGPGTPAPSVVGRHCSK